jgi:hypothetical protein
MIPWSDKDEYPNENCWNGLQASNEFLSGYFFETEGDFLKWIAEHFARKPVESNCR